MKNLQAPSARAEAWLGALKLLAQAARAEVKKFDKLAKSGALLDPEQRTVLAWVADKLTVASLGDGANDAQQLLLTVEEEASPGSSRSRR